MQYALVNGKKSEAQSGVKGICDVCGETTIAKCGTRIVHHWAHQSRVNCDSWWENETPWHREWKNRFPPECREISHTSISGEIHRADIKTPAGLVIEVQHSPISDAERQSREEFYPELVWVIDGSVFRKNFDLYHRLPNPNSTIAQDKKWHKAKRNMNGSNTGIFNRPSQIKPDDLMVEIFNATEIRDSINEFYSGHHQYDWIKPRSTWLDSSCSVYIDFGDKFLLRLENYGEYELPSVRSVSKDSFISGAMNVSTAKRLNPDYYPLPDHLYNELYPKRGDLRGVVWENRNVQNYVESLNTKIDKELSPQEDVPF